MSGQYPLCSSAQVVRAPERAGFTARGKPSGSHQAFIREVDGRRYVAIVVLGKKEIPRGTLKNILQQAGLTLDELLEYLR